METIIQRLQLAIKSIDIGLLCNFQRYEVIKIGVSSADLLEYKEFLKTYYHSQCIQTNPVNITRYKGYELVVKETDKIHIFVEAK